jgi:hypothetical protein
VWICRQIPLLRRNILSPSSGLVVSICLKLHVALQPRSPRFIFSSPPQFLLHCIIQFNISPPYWKFTSPSVSLQASSSSSFPSPPPSTYFKEKSHSSEIHNRSDNNEIPGLIWNQKVRCRVNTFPPVDFILKRINLVHTVTPYFFTNHSKIRPFHYLRLCLHVLRFQVFRLKFCKYLLLSLHACYMSTSCHHL